MDWQGASAGASAEGSAAEEEGEDSPRVMPMGPRETPALSMSSPALPIKEASSATSSAEEAEEGDLDSPKVMPMGPRERPTFSRSSSALPMRLVLAPAPPSSSLEARVATAGARAPARRPILSLLFAAPARRDAVDDGAAATRRTRDRAEEEAEAVAAAEEHEAPPSARMVGACMLLSPRGRGVWTRAPNVSGHAPRFSGISYPPRCGREFADLILRLCVCSQRIMRNSEVPRWKSPSPPSSTSSLS